MYSTVVLEFVGHMTRPPLPLRSVKVLLPIFLFDFTLGNFEAIKRLVFALWEWAYVQLFLGNSSVKTSMWCEPASEGDCVGPTKGPNEFPHPDLNFCLLTWSDTFPCAVGPPSSDYIFDTMSRQGGDQVLRTATLQPTFNSPVFQQVTWRSNPIQKSLQSSHALVVSTFPHRALSKSVQVRV